MLIWPSDLLSFRSSCLFSGRETINIALFLVLGDYFSACHNVFPACRCLFLAEFIANMFQALHLYLFLCSSVCLLLNLKVSLLRSFSCCCFSMKNINLGLKILVSHTWELLKYPLFSLVRSDSSFVHMYLNGILERTAAEKLLSNQLCKTIRQLSRIPTYTAVRYSVIGLVCSHLSASSRQREV